MIHRAPARSARDVLVKGRDAARQTSETLENLRAFVTGVRTGLVTLPPSMSEDQLCSLDRRVAACAAKFEVVWDEKTSTWSQGPARYAFAAEMTALLAQLKKIAKDGT